MNDDDEDSSGKVGYGRPPKATRFKPGQSGNLKGRPRKRERSFLPRQARTDALEALGQTLVVNIGGKRKRMSVIQAAYVALGRKAASGHYPSMKLLIEENRANLQAHFEAHDEFKLLEYMEKRAVVGVDLTDEFWERLNELRRATRKTG